MPDTTALSAGRPGALVGGRYRLVELVGRGGSAGVWSAEDQALGRRVALKLVTTTGGDDAGRVGDEARLLARLSHPGLVPVYDAGTDESGRPWVVMELVVGETLADAVARGALPSERVAEIGRVLADALAYVHGEGLVHRDVKPANVLLGHDGRVRLTDFGIARLVDAARVTATGFTVGTASYLSPEQVLGSHVGPLADVYSLGLVLLECLTGRREYPGTAVEVALARLHRQPVVPTSLPSGWPALLTAMTAREPEGRPTAHEVAADLGRITAGGEATTVLRSTAAPTAATERLAPTDATQLLPPAPATAQRPAPRPVPRPAPSVPVAPPRRGGWTWALLLVALVALVVLGYVVVDSRSDDPGGPVPGVSTDLPPQLRQDLEQLKAEVGS